MWWFCHLALAVNLLLFYVVMTPSDNFSSFFSFFFFHTHSLITADMWPNHENEDEEPDWVKSERRQFVEFRDQNKDGRLDNTEVKRWIVPDDFDHARAEAKHLMFESDGDKVCILLLVQTVFV